MKCLCFLLFFSIYGILKGQNPLPTRAQLAWHEMEFYLFMHFGPNTFTDREWGEGTEPSEIFNPVKLDTGGM